MQYTKEDYQRELNEFLEQLNAKAEKHGVFKSKDEEEREKKEKAVRLEKTTDTYISYISRHDKAREMIKQLKANGYDLKFSTEMNSQYTDDAIIVNVSSENPDDLPQDEVSDVVQIMDKFISYHTHYKQIKNLYNSHFLANNGYFESMFEYAAVKECCKNSCSFIELKNVKKLMLMTGVYMYEMGLKCGEGGHISTRLKRVLKKITNCFIRTKTNYGNTTVKTDDIANLYLLDKNCEFNTTSADFCLRMPDDSMIGLGIKPRDLLFFKKHADIKDGDIVAVLADGLYHLGRIYFKDDYIVLSPQNASYKSKFYHKEDDITVCGKLIMLQHKFEDVEETL